jgi:hypothetical protein
MVWPSSSTSAWRPRQKRKKEELLFGEAADEVEVIGRGKEEGEEENK